MDSTLVYAGKDGIVSGPITKSSAPNLTRNENLTFQYNERDNFLPLCGNNSNEVTPVGLLQVYTITS